jgi:hypothetical protein
MNDRTTFLEVSNMGKSEPEKKIDRILSASVKYLGKRMGKPCYLQLTIDSAELVFRAEKTGACAKIDVDASIEKLNSQIDDLHIHELAGFEGFLI